ncbi:MAG: clan AA aspartic protease [Blastocatellia bacterium]|nr:clan AA aspartic protease [Blastocatellia bacterium]
MGEVRVKVKITNAADDTLARRKQLPVGEVRTLTATALVDTGAVRLVLPSFVAEQLGLERVGKQVAEYADGRLDEVDVTEPVYIEIDGRRTADEALVLGDEVLIGQTVLEKTDMQVDCAGRQLIPNPAHPDQPVSKVKRVR